MKQRPSVRCSGLQFKAYTLPRRGGARCCSVARRDGWARTTLGWLPLPNRSTRMLWARIARRSSGWGRDTSASVRSRNSESLPPAGLLRAARLGLERQSVRYVRRLESRSVLQGIQPGWFHALTPRQADHRAPARSSGFSFARSSRDGRGAGGSRFANASRGQRSELCCRPSVGTSRTTGITIGPDATCCRGLRCQRY